jgi:hypothetical protein
MENRQDTGLSSSDERFEPPPGAAGVMRARCWKKADDPGSKEPFSVWVLKSVHGKGFESPGRGILIFHEAD